MKAPVALARFEERVLPLMLDHYEPGCCILVTRVVVETLRALGFQAAPLPCYVLAWNPRGAQLLDAGQTPMQVTEDDEAWSVGVGVPGAPEEAGRWNGHLALTVDGYLSDMTLGQAARPQRGMPLGPLTVGLPTPRKEFLRGRSSLSFSGFGGCRLEYAVRPENRGFLESRDWTVRERRASLVDAAVRAVRS